MLLLPEREDELSLTVLACGKEFKITEVVLLSLHRPMWQPGLLSSLVNIRWFINPKRSVWPIAKQCIICKRLYPNAACTRQRISEQLEHLLWVDTPWFTGELENTPEFLNDCLTAKRRTGMETCSEEEVMSHSRQVHCVVIRIEGSVFWHKI